MRPIRVMFAGPDREFRLGLRNAFAVGDRFEFLTDAGRLERLPALVAGGHPDILVLELSWLDAASGLLAGFTSDRPGCRVVLAAESVAAPELAPELLAAVQQGVRGCGAKASTPAEWRRTLIAVHEGEIWLPRWLLVEALSDLQQVMQPAAAQLDGLTGRQREILCWVANGLSNKEIGRRMGISPATVKTHLQNIFERTGVSGRRRIVAQAHREAAADADGGVTRRQTPEFPPRAKHD